MRRPPRRSTGPSEARGYPGREVGGAGPGTPRLRPRAPPTWQTQRHRPPRRQCGRRETLPGRGAAHPGVRVPIGNPWARPTAGLRVRWSSSAHVCRTPLKAPPPCKVVGKQGRGSHPLNIPRGGGGGGDGYHPTPPRGVHPRQKSNYAEARILEVGQILLEIRQGVSAAHSQPDHADQFPEH